MKLKTKNIRIVTNDHGDKFKRAGSTDKFIYYVNESESDDNANTIMFDIDTLEMVSNNYFANQSLIEDVEDEKFVKIDKWFEYNYKTILENKE